MSRKLYSIPVLSTILILTAFDAICFSQLTKSLDRERVIKVIDTCLSAFEENYVYPDVVIEIEDYVRKKIETDSYAHISTLTQLTKQLRADFRHVSDDRHIWIDIMENLPTKDSDLSDDKKIAELRRNNFGFTKYELLDNNVAYLRLDGFENLDFAEDTAIAIMSLLSNSDAIILDMRQNHGGNGNMVHFLSSYFFEERTQLNSLYFRAKDSLSTAWTDPDVPGEKLLRQKLFILTGRNTASAAESFAYTMKNYNRAILVGENTRGAAHWNESYQFPELGIFLEIPVARPINPVTQKGWQGIGVIPDVVVPEEEALDKAYILASKRDE